MLDSNLEMIVTGRAVCSSHEAVLCHSPTPLLILLQEIGDLVTYIVCPFIAHVRLLSPLNLKNYRLDLNEPCLSR